MNYLKKINIYKYLNVILLLFTANATLYLNYNYSNYCLDEDIYCYYNFYDKVYDPLYFSGFILSVILGGLLLVPAHIFRKWLFYVAPLVIIATYFLVIDISVYSSNVMQFTRANMAQLGMYFLGAVTFMFVWVHLFLDWRQKTKRSVKNS